MRRREVLAMLIALAVAGAVLVFMLTADIGWPTSPLKRAPEQNSGAAAPAETQSPAGTYEQDGTTRMPADQNNSSSGQ